MSVQEIVKVQKSLANSDGRASLLISNKDQSFTLTMPFVGPVAKAMRQHVKRYFVAELKHGKAYIESVAPEQSW